MKTTCPQCGNVFETAQARREPVERLNAVYAGFGLEEATVREYIDCFRVSRESANSIPKEMRLLKELVSMWAVELFSYRGRNFRTTREKIRDAMVAACNRQLIGLMNHNYIKKILFVQAQAEGIREEREKHEKAQQRLRKPGQGIETAGSVIDRHSRESGNPATFDFAAARENARKAREKVFGKKED